MARIVQKFGGTSVADIDLIRRAAGRTRQAVERGDEVAVVVSAMAGATNRLVDWTREAAVLHDAREYDVVVSAGEQVTAGLMAMVLPHMKAQRWGRIVNISSIYGREYGGSIDYMTGKAGLIAFSKHLALNLMKENVLVNCIAPGSIDFPGSSWDRFQKNSTPEEVKEFIDRNLPAGKFGWPEPIGDTVAFLASENASMITGTCLNVDGGQSRSLL